jgi:hypothetical protein
MARGNSQNILPLVTLGIGLMLLTAAVKDLDPIQATKNLVTGKNPLDAKHAAPDPGAKPNTLPKVDTKGLPPDNSKPANPPAGWSNSDGTWELSIAAGGSNQSAKWEFHANPDAAQRHGIPLPPGGLTKPGDVAGGGQISNWYNVTTGQWESAITATGPVID